MLGRFRMASLTAHSPLLSEGVDTIGVSIEPARTFRRGQEFEAQTGVCLLRRCAPRPQAQPRAVVVPPLGDRGDWVNVTCSCRPSPVSHGCQGRGSLRRPRDVCPVAERAPPRLRSKRRRGRPCFAGRCW